MPKSNAWKVNKNTATLDKVVNFQGYWILPVYPAAMNDGAVNHHWYLNLILWLWYQLKVTSKPNLGYLLLLYLTH